MLIGANDTTNLPMPTENLRYICYNFIQKILYYQLIAAKKPTMH